MMTESANKEYLRCSHAEKNNCKKTVKKLNALKSHKLPMKGEINIMTTENYFHF